MPRPAPARPRALRLALVSLACAFVVGAFTTVARAESRRAAHVVGLFVDQPALLVGGDRAFVPALPDGAVTVCSYASGACAPIRSAEPCSGASCPSGGTILRLETSLASVGELPTDREGLQRLQLEIASDPHVSSMTSWLAQPPPPPPPAPPPSFHLDEGDWRFVVGFGGGVAAHVDAGPVTGSMYGSLAFGIGMTWDREEVLQVLFGSALGAELRVRMLPSIEGASFEQAAVLVGFAPHAIWAPAREPFGIGAGYFSLLPEVGVITHPTLPTAFYFGWSYPIAFAFDAHVGLEVRPFAYIVDDWIEGDEVGWLAGADVNLLVF